MRGGLDRARRDDLIARFDLDPTKKGRTYSKGNRQKVALVAALASDVELLLLDEPTAGLDPLMDATFRDHIEAFRADGRTVLLSSHILSEVEALCDRVSIIRQGVVVESGTMAQLRHLTRTSVVAEVDMVPAGLEHLPGVHDVVVAGRRVTASVESHGLSPLMASLGSGGLTSLTTAPPTLEELFLRHYRDVLAGTGSRHPATGTARWVAPPAPADVGGGGRHDHRLGPDHHPAASWRRGMAAGLVARRWSAPGQMLRLALRRDRVLVPAWVLGIAGHGHASPPRPPSGCTRTCPSGSRPPRRSTGRPPSSPCTGASMTPRRSVSCRCSR